MTGPRAGVGAGAAGGKRLAGGERETAVTFLTMLIFWGVVFGVLGGVVTNQKGRGWGEGIALGAILGIIGLIIALCLKSQQPAPPAVRSVPAPPPPPQLPPAGWYPDPQGNQRYWDGARWTAMPAPPASGGARPAGKAQRHREDA